MKLKTKSITWTVACALLVSTVGATAGGSATQAGHSPIYQLDVTYNGNVAGKVTVNTANAQLPSYLLVARGLTPNMQYTFGYTTASGEVYTIGSTDTPKAGALVINGTFPLDDVEDLQSAQFWVMETPFGDSDYSDCYEVTLQNNGWFVAKLACYYSTDGGVTWTESDHTDGIPMFDEAYDVHLCDLGVPDGALVRIHAIVVAGTNRTASDIWCYHSYKYAPYVLWAPKYEVYGTTLTSKLQYNGAEPVN